ncbi:GNAT family N-acetyltransferase [Streptomyces sp. NPDC017254]|uniref:GNAT family N-acetyltransferase n=1 Tax=unclassified Streptomyces TaxID=2593676 RepID=UPI0037877322
MPVPASHRSPDGLRDVPRRGGCVVPPRPVIPYGDAAWPRLIFDGDRLVGFLMAFLDLPWNEKKDPTDRRSGLWRLNIAAEGQGRGYGRFAVDAVRDELRRRGEQKLYVTWEPGEDGPGTFYERLGFRATGETSGDQTVGVLDI